MPLLFRLLVDLAYWLAGASRLVLIHSSAPDSLSYRVRDIEMTDLFHLTEGKKLL